MTEPTNLDNVDPSQLEFVAETYGIETQVLKLGEVCIVPETTDDGTTYVEVVSSDNVDIHDHIE